MKKISVYYFLSLLGLIVGLQGCYYDNGEDLYQFVTPQECDTVNVSFSTTVIPIMENNCLTCHSGSAPSGNINLEGYNNLLPHMNSGRLLGAIRHEAGYSPMPKGANQLPDCEIEKLNAWVVQGAKNN